MEDLELSEELWRKGGVVAEKVAESIDDDDEAPKGNAFDTAAHFFAKAGDIDYAIEIQEKAVDFNNDDQLRGYLKELRKIKKMMTK